VAFATAVVRGEGAGYAVGVQGTQFVYRVCVRSLRTGSAYRVCVQGLRTQFAYRVFAYEMSTMTELFGKLHVMKAMEEACALQSRTALVELLATKKRKRECEREIEHLSRRLRVLRKMEQQQTRCHKTREKSTRDALRTQGALLQQIDAKGKVDLSEDSSGFGVLRLVFARHLHILYGDIALLNLRMTDLYCHRLCNEFSEQFCFLSSFRCNPLRVMMPRTQLFCCHPQQCTLLVGDVVSPLWLSKAHIDAAKMTTDACLPTLLQWHETHRVCAYLVVSIKSTRITIVPLLCKQTNQTELIQMAKTGRVEAQTSHAYRRLYKQSGGLNTFCGFVVHNRAALWKLPFVWAQRSKSRVRITSDAEMCSTSRLDVFKYMQYTQIKHKQRTPEPAL